MDIGVDVGVIERKGFLYDKNFKLLKEIPSHYNEKNLEVVFTFEHPKNYFLLPDSRLKVGFLVYEFSELPQLWVDNINKHLDLVFVPSKFTYNIFIRSGVIKEKVRILRYGFNPNYYYPRKKESGKIKNFLTISSPHKREGLLFALESFYKASLPYDATLTVKLSYLNKAPKIFEDDVLKIIEDYKIKIGKRLVIIDKVLDERDMGELYRENDVYFSLSKAESFGLCPLEAIACGLWNVALNYGGQSDFLNDKNSFFVKYYLDKTKNDEYEKTDKTQYIAYPYIDDAANKLKEIYNKKFLNPQFDYEYYKWSVIAIEFINEIKKYIK